MAASFKTVEKLNKKSIYRNIHLRVTQAQGMVKFHKNKFFPAARLWKILANDGPKNNFLRSAPFQMFFLIFTSQLPRENYGLPVINRVKAI